MAVTRSVGIVSTSASRAAAKVAFTASPSSASTEGLVTSGMGSASMAASRISHRTPASSVAPARKALACEPVIVSAPGPSTSVVVG